MDSEELRKDFTTIVQHRLSHVSVILVLLVYKELVKRIINVSMNSIVNTHRILTQIKDNKGVSADTSLRDKLKVYSLDVHSKFSL